MEEEKKRFSKIKDLYKPLTDWWKDQLTALTENGDMKDAGVKIEKVEISKRLTESPVVVVTSQFGYSAQQEKVMKAQAFQNKDQLSMMSGRKTLEINPNHPVIADLLAKVKVSKDDKPALDTSALVNRVYRLMSKELGVDPDAPLKEVEVPEEEEEAEEEKDEGDEEKDDEEKDDDEEEGDAKKEEL